MSSNLTYVSASRILWLKGRTIMIAQPTAATMAPTTHTVSAPPANRGSVLAALAAFFERAGETPKTDSERYWTSVARGL
jgi:hypothetical protein